MTLDLVIALGALGIAATFYAIGFFHGRRSHQVESGLRTSIKAAQKFAREVRADRGRSDRDFIHLL